MVKFGEQVLPTFQFLNEPSKLLIPILAVFNLLTQLFVLNFHCIIAADDVIILFLVLFLVLRHPCIPFHSILGHFHQDADFLLHGISFG